MFESFGIWDFLADEYSRARCCSNAFNFHRTVIVQIWSSYFWIWSALDTKVLRDTQDRDARFEHFTQTICRLIRGMCSTWLIFWNKLFP